MRAITFKFMLLGCVLLCSCQRASEFYFVKNAGAIMPVKISGKTDSDVFIVLLPGGPSGDGLVYSRIFPVFKKQLEANYRMVYYDQRGAGNCQGVYDVATLNLPQLSEDLSKVIATIKSRNENAKVYLLGYSFGGAVGLNYLLNADYRNGVEGFIGLAGAYDRVNQRQEQNALIEYLLEQWVTEGYIANYDALKSGYSCDDQPDKIQCRTDSILLKQKVDARLEDLGRYNQYKLDGGALFRLLGYVFFSQSNPIYSGIAEAQNGQYFQEEFDQLSLSEAIGDIDIPLLLINGRFDTNVPFFEAQKLYEGIGTTSKNKSLIILEQSGHLPMITEPEKLTEAIINFLKQD